MSSIRQSDPQERVRDHDRSVCMGITIYKDAKIRWPGISNHETKDGQEPDICSVHHSFFVWLVLVLFLGFFGGGVSLH